MTDVGKILDDIIQKEYEEFIFYEIIFERWKKTWNSRKKKYNSVDFYKWCKDNSYRIEDYIEIKPNLKKIWIQKINRGEIPKDQLVGIKI